MATKRIAVMDEFPFQHNVIDRITQASLESTTPWTKGDRYLMTDGANINKIAYANTSGSGAYVSGDWTYLTPLEGWNLWVNDEDSFYKFDGTNWSVNIGATGPTGPTGPTGATGATGPTGPTGPGATYVAEYKCLEIEYT